MIKVLYTQLPLELILNNNFEIYFDALNDTYKSY